MTKLPATVVDTRLADLAEAAVVRSIGNTPLVRLRRFERHLGLPESIEIHLKMEWVNPGRIDQGSDRAVDRPLCPRRR